MIPTALGMTGPGARRAEADPGATPGGTPAAAMGPREAPGALLRGAGASLLEGRGGGPVPQTAATEVTGPVGARHSLPPCAAHLV